MDKQFQNSPKILTNEEEADEIMRRLAAPPKPKLRTLTASWTIESLADLGAEFDIDLEDELSKALSDSIAAEIDNEMLKEMRKWKI